MSKKVLLVDDEALIAMSQAKLLETHEYEAVTAYSGKKAIEVVDSDPEISLILMDIDLGKDRDGTEVAQKILEKHDIPIVFLTSHAEKDYVDKVKKITGYGYVLKNSGEFVLIEAIRMAYQLFDSHKKLHEKEAQLNLALDAEEHGYWDWNLDTDEIYFSPKYCQMLGYEPDELPKHYKTWEKLLHPEDRENAVEAIKEKIELVHPFDLEFRLRCKSGKWKWIKGKGHLYNKDKNGIPHRFVGTHEDITERKQAEQRIQESEKKYKSLFHQSPVSITIHDKDTGEVIDANQVAFKVYGLNSISEFKENNFWMEPPYSFNEALELIHRAATEGLQEFEWKNRNTLGDVFWEYVTLRLITINDEERVLSTAVNISKQKKAETTLREKTEILNNTIENISDFVVLTDLYGCITFHSNFNDTLGYEQDSLIGRNVLEFVHPEDFSEIEYSFREFIGKSKDTKRVEYRFRCANESYIWMETDGKTIKDEEGNIKKVLFSARDITARKKAQEAIKKSEEQYRLITENALDIIVQVDEQSRPTYMSPSVTAILGYTVDDIGDRPILDFLPPVDRKRIEEMVEGGINKKERQSTHIHRVYTKSGKILWMETNVNRIFDEDGQFIGATYISRDITEIRKLEQVSNERRQLLEALLEAAPNAIITFDSLNKINEWNRGAEELFHYTREEVLGCNIDEIVSRQQDVTVHEEALSFTQKAVTGKSVPPTETIRFTKEGEALPLIVAGSSIMVDGDFKGVVATYTDISQLKKKEKEVEILLEEKEHLLHEVHHRIKNHMSTISSIISLRASHIDKPQIRDVLEEVQDKVSLMQNIYQSLYTGEDVGTIRISSYLGPVLHDIQYAYIDSQSITITTDIEEIEVTSKQSLPIGIIITELLTNSIKYAFQGSDGGEIHVTMHKDKENTGFLCIEVSDNGKGMPPEILKNGEYGFGLTLVEGYTKQFDGTMSISTTGGTKVRVVLELE